MQCRNQLFFSTGMLAVMTTDMDKMIKILS